jgi:hypothetical protein
MTEKQSDINFLEKCCLAHDLSTYDPYDIWMLPLGIWVKQLFNRNKYLGLLPAALVTLMDHFVNNSFRLGYVKREYPAVRAMAALSLLQLYKGQRKEAYLYAAKEHIDWLVENSSKGYAGLCWGLGFKWAADDGLDYVENTPFSTHTPYALEAIHTYILLSGDESYTPHITSIFNFYERDIKVIFESEEAMATSYGPCKDRLITNAVSYTLYAYTLFLGYFPEREQEIKGKIQKLYRFVRSKQRADGSWLYAPDDAHSFIDCFHSCFVLKNIFKSNTIVSLEGSSEVITKGYHYIKTYFYDVKTGLFRRFSLSNKPSIIKYDLYDNAEMLHLALLLKDEALVTKLGQAISKTFVTPKGIYSVVDIFHNRKNKNTLRWAAMPYLYALSTQNSNGAFTNGNS